MAGIYGFLQQSGCEDVESALSTLRIAALGGLDLPVHEHTFSNAGIGCAVPHHYSPTRWPLVSKEGTHAVAVFGEIILPDGAQLRAHNFEEGFLRPLLRNRLEFIPKLSGWFVFGMLSKEGCMLVNDASGNFAIHYTVNSNHFAFSTQMLPLQKWNAAAGFDERGLFQHLGVSQSLNGGTLLTNISRLRRGTILNYAGGRTETQEYVRRKFVASTEPKRELEQVHRSLADAVSRSSRYERVTAALSGGFDSRMTWSLLLETDRKDKIAASTHGLPNSRDLKISAMIARKFGLVSDRLLFTPDIITQTPSRLREFVARTEGLCPLSQIFSYYAMEALGTRYSVLIDSYGGALYRRQIKKFIEPRIDPSSEIATQVLPYEQTPLLRSGLLKPDVRHYIDEASLLGLREYYATIEHISQVGDKFDLFYAEQTVALRDACSANYQMNYIGLAQPLMDSAALAAVAKVPIRIRQKEGVHKYIIHEACPELERFSLDYSGFPAPYRGFSTLRLVAPALEKLLRSMGRSIRPLRGFSLRRPPFSAWDVLQSDLRLTEELLLAPHPLYDLLIERTALEKKLRSRQNLNEEAPALLQLLQFRLFLDIFY